MIIEIKDLPKDRNVKKITFDIEFEDGEVKSIKSVDNNPTSPKNEKVSIPETKTSLEIPEIINTDIDKPVIDISKREPKIDDDIMNMEF